MSNMLNNFLRKVASRTAKREENFPVVPIITVETPLGLKVPYIEVEGREPKLLENISSVEKGYISPEDDQLLNNVSLKPGAYMRRRNSISLPNLDDFEVDLLALRTNKDGDGNDDGSDFSNDSDIEDSSDSNGGGVTSRSGEIPVRRKVPLRNVRRKSVTRMLKPGEFDHAGYSPANSITSVNSLASLLREKIQMLPTTLRKTQPNEYKVRVFVGFIFLAIVLLVSLAYMLYQQKVLARAYFERIKFNKAKREIRIFNYDENIVISGILGTAIGYDKVHPCLPSDNREDGSICFEWMERARLYIQLYELDSEVRCYNLQWIALAEGVEPTDCYDMSPASGYWYGGGQLAESIFQLGRASHNFAPFVTGNIETHRWGNVLKRYFINSKGAAIVIDNSTPLYVSIKNNTANTRKEFCMRAKYDDFTFVNRITRLPQLNYSICTATNMTKLHSFMAEKKLWDGLRPEESNIIHSLLTEPLWEITAATKHDFFEEAVSNYTSDVIGLGFLKQGHVLLNEFWQEHVGDFTVDENRFPTFQETIEIMHRRGFRIVFTIQPFISTESKNFAEAVKRRLLISERFSDRRIPALTRYKSLQSAGVLDMTNNNTVPWIVDKLKTLLSTFKFDAYYLDLGIAYNMPHYYQCEKSLINPDQYKTYFVNGLQSSVNIFGVNSAIERPKTPTFVSLPMFESSWTGLRKIIPAVLTYGLIGYPFLIPGAVGGDYGSAEGISGTSFNASLNTKLPDKELYVRWLQLATFLPVIRFTHLPSSYGDESVLEMAKVMTSLRQQIVTPALKKYVGVALEYGMPLVRPLWMLDPSDASCHTAVDEFSVGDDLIVAPILHSGVREREVYLPAGVWKDGIDNSLRKGSRWIHDYRVEEDQIAYFIKMPDDTRF